MGCEEDRRAKTLPARNYRDLLAWQKAMDLGEKVYAATARFPNHEQYGLRSQIRRAAVSIPSNIAERLGYINAETQSQLLGLSAEIGRLINGLANKLQARI